MTETLPTIETSVYSRLDWMIRRIAGTAGLGIARGAVGIGKTYCMTQIGQRLKDEGAKVLMTTCPPSTEGNPQAFLKSFLSARGFHQKGVVECTEAFEELVVGNPFGFPSRPAILLVDECQGARAPLLTMRRQLWDLGDAARLSRESGPAFGLLLCGNFTFLNRRGRLSEMDIHPWSCSHGLIP